MTDDYVCERDYLRLTLLQTVLGVLGRDFVTEDVIRDVKKIESELFS